MDVEKQLIGMNTMEFAVVFIFLYTCSKPMYCFLCYFTK